ncbi:MAG: hypothetical protein KBD16_01225 [Candidatus Pacebacteria bacterium]|nr:hypothetical protein [Candidatus Paceibacterota bacterium]
MNREVSRFFGTTVAFLALVLPTLLFAADPPGLVPCSGPDCNFSDFITLIQRIMNFLLKIAIPIAVVLFSWAGFQYLTAMGDEGKIKSARSLMTSVFVGFGIALAAYLIVNVLTTVFLGNGQSANEPFKGGMNIQEMYTNTYA